MCHSSFLFNIAAFDCGYIYFSWLFGSFFFSSLRCLPNLSSCLYHRHSDSLCTWCVHMYIVHRFIVLPTYSQWPLITRYNLVGFVLYLFEECRLVTISQRKTMKMAKVVTAIAATAVVAHHRNRKHAAKEYIFHKIFMLASVDLTSYQYSYRVNRHEIYIVKSSILWKLELQVVGTTRHIIVIQHMGMIKYGVICSIRFTEDILESVMIFSRFSAKPAA